MPAGMDTASSLAIDIWQSIYGHLPNEDLVRSRLVCKEFDEWLRPLVKELCTRKPIAQSSLELLANSYRNLAVLYISLEYEAETEPLDWENVHLPNLRDLRLSYCPLHSIVFTEANTPSLVSLHIKVQEHAAEGFNVSLPELTHGHPVCRGNACTYHVLLRPYGRSALPCNTALLLIKAV